MLLAVAVLAEAQQPAKVPRIGFLTGLRFADPARVEAFRQGLRELGYVEGKNIAIEWRYAEGKTIASRSSRPNWFVSTWMSSSRGVRQRPVLPSKRPVRFPSSWV